MQVFSQPIDSTVITSRRVGVHLVEQHKERQALRADANSTELLLGLQPVIRPPCRRRHLHRLALQTCERLLQQDPARTSMNVSKMGDDCL
jgi:hypothetical protein